MDQVATIPTTIPAVNSERRITPSFVAICRLRIKRMHSTRHGGGNQGALDVEYRDMARKSTGGGWPASVVLQIGCPISRALFVRETTSLLNQRPAVTVRLCFRRDHYRCGYLVAGFHVEEADTLSVSSRFADRRRVHADDFAIVADQHDFGGFVDLRDGYDFAHALRGLYVDHAF